MARKPSTNKKAKKKDETKEEEVSVLGRPSSYDTKYAEQVSKLCALGATDEEIADFFGVSVRTIHRWKLQHEDFCHALKSGKELADDRIERSLYQRASGYTYVEQQAFKVKTVQYDNGKRILETEEIKVVDVERYAVPDTTAAIFWLKNRRSEDWRDVSRHEVGKPGDFDRMSKDELAEYIRAEAAALGVSHIPPQGSRRSGKARSQLN